MVPCLHVESGSVNTILTFDTVVNADLAGGLNFVEAIGWSGDYTFDAGLTGGEWLSNPLRCEFFGAGLGFEREGCASRQPVYPRPGYGTQWVLDNGSTPPTDFGMHLAFNDTCSGYWSNLPLS